MIRHQTPIALAALLMIALLVISGRSEGAAIVMDESSITVNPVEPVHDGMLTVNATVLFIGATPTSVTLKFSMCTESQCGLDTSVPMVRGGSPNQWTAQIGPFAKEDASGDPYIDVKLHVLAKGTATDGGEDPETDSPVKLVYFKEGDNGEDPDDSPAPIDLLLVTIMAISMALVLRHRRS